MSEIKDLIEMAKETDRNAVMESSALSVTLETIKMMIRNNVIMDFNENGNSEFGISDFDVSLDRRSGTLNISLNGLYYRSTGNGVYAGSCDDFALSKLERDVERIIRVKMQTETEVSVKYSFYSK